MRLRFLGTGASEGIPNIFCKCDVCENARRVGGKEQRTRSGVLINDNLLIDFPPDLLTDMLRYGIDGTAVKNILITHSHSDHFYPEDIVFNLLSADRPDTLTVCSNSTVLEKLRDMSEKNNVEKRLALCEPRLEKTIELGGYRVTAFGAIHMKSEQSLLFLVEKDGKTYLHLYDTGIVPDEVFAWLKANGVIVDALAIDTTYGLVKENYSYHMNLKQVESVCERLRAAKVITENTKVIASHICHFAGTHENLSKAAQSCGITVAYDGMIVDVE